MSEPIFTLVNTKTLDESGDLDYASGTMDQHEEVRLTDIDGDPCAVVTKQEERDYDIRYDYGNGNQTAVAVGKQHALSVYVDWLPGEQRAKLHRWHMNRDTVWFTPGFGRDTELAWRPVEATASSFADLTGNHTLDINGDATRKAFWDDLNGDVMREGGGYNQRLIRTPGGAGQVFERATQNIATGSWVVTGAGLSSATVTNGFGYADAPDSLRVYGTLSGGDSGSVALFVTASGAGTLNAGVWVRGRFPEDRATLSCGGGAVHLTGRDLSNWTRIDVQNAGTFAGTGLVYFSLNSANDPDDQYVDFEIGPVVATFEAVGSQYSQAYPTWQTTGAAKSADYLQTSSNFTVPRSGTIMSSFFVPEWYDEPDSQVIGLGGPDHSSNTAGQFFLISYNSNTATRLVYYNSATNSIAAEVSPVPGAVNTASVTWGHSGLALYFNGQLVTSRATAADYACAYPTSVDYRIGHVADYDRGAWPFILTGYRLERAVWDSERMAHEHATVSEPIATGPITMARGRKYEIVSLPTTPKASASATYWEGEIVLRSVDYDPDLSDLTTKE